MHGRQALPYGSRFDRNMEFDRNFAVGRSLEFFSAMRESTDPAAQGDSAVPILFGTAMLLIVLIAAAAAIAVGGVAYLDLLRGALALTAGSQSCAR